MSREFRYVLSGYFHSVLDEAASEPGNHDISIALSAIYLALAPVERACAGFEASDNGPAYPLLTLQGNWSAIESAIETLKAIHRRDLELIEDLLRDRQEKRQTPLISSEDAEAVRMGGDR